ncbi:unnamed protein product [Cunninghamella blakesleeana]
MVFEEDIEVEKPTRTRRWKERLSRNSTRHSQVQQLLHSTTPSNTNGTLSSSSSTTTTTNNETYSIEEKENLLLSQQKQQQIPPPLLSTNHHSKPPIYNHNNNNNNNNNDNNSNNSNNQTDVNKNKEFHQHFKNIPINDILLQDFKCALYKDVFLHGRLYITKNNVCFKSNILGYVTCVEIAVKDIKNIERLRNIKLMPRFIQITMKNDDKYSFTSFLTSISARDEAYYKLLDVWQQMNPHLNITKSIEQSSYNDGGNNNNDLHDNNNEGIHSPSSTLCTPTSNMANITNHQDKSNTNRKRAHTLSDYNHIFHFIPINRSRSLSSSAAAATATKSNSNHVSWNDHSNSPSNNNSILSNHKLINKNNEEDNDDVEDGGESDIEEEEGENDDYIKSKEIKKPIMQQKSNDQNPSDENQHHKNKNYLSMMILIGGLLFFISHIILTYRFYYVTRHIKDQLSSPCDHFPPHHRPMVQTEEDSFLMSAHLRGVKDQAQVWMKESIRQRQQLLDLMEQ